MTGEGVVVRTAGKRAVIKIHKSSACGQDCGHCHACDNPEYEVWADNVADARPGDRVLLEMPSHSVLGLAFLLYLLPVFAAFAALICLPGWAAKCIGLAVLIGLWFLVLRYVNKTHSMQHKIVEVLH